METKNYLKFVTIVLVCGYNFLVNNSKLTDLAPVYIFKFLSSINISQETLRLVYYAFLYVLYWFYDFTEDFKFLAILDDNNLWKLK